MADDGNDKIRPIRPNVQKPGAPKKRRPRQTGKPYGRPSKQLEGKPLLVELLLKGNTRIGAAKVARIDYSTFRAWIRADAEFARQCDEAEAKAEAEMVACIRKAAKLSWKAAAWWLERKRPEEWGQKHEITVREAVTTSDDALLLQYKQLEDMSHEELLAEIEKYDRAISVATGREAAGSLPAPTQSHVGPDARNGAHNGQDHA